MVNRPVIDRGLFPSTKTHGQEGADRGYPLCACHSRLITTKLTGDALIKVAYPSVREEPAGRGAM